MCVGRRTMNYRYTALLRLTQFHSYGILFRTSVPGC